MPGGLSRLLIRAFVHRPFRNGNDRWRRGEVGGTVRVEYTRGEGNGETRIFLRRYSIPLSLRFRNSTIQKLYDSLLPTNFSQLSHRPLFLSLSNRRLPTFESSMKRFRKTNGLLFEGNAQKKLRCGERERENSKEPPHTRNVLESAGKRF